MLVIAHLSDTHFDGGPHAAERAGRVMSYLKDCVARGPARTIDAVLVTGDIADHGAAGEYAEAAEILVTNSNEPPVLLLPGNHDVRGPFRQVLLGEPESDRPINRLREVAGAAFLLCDSTIPGRVEGLLDDESIGWIESTLAGLGSGTPTFICFHHPPVTLGMDFMDGIRQFHTGRLAALVRDNSDVVGVLCGHAHSAAASTFAGKPMIVAPGVASTVTLPWESKQVVDYRPPPAVAFHILDDEGRLTTHYRPVL
ncbi:MAG TPA: metallophosphoesterase [Jatrophihabitans sp.]|jgi:3',5'-cyclic AMP phosphodiesterase CpdA